MNSKGRRSAKLGATLRFRPALFLVVLPSVYVLLHFAYFALPDDFLRDYVHYYGIVVPAATIVNFVAPHEAAAAAQGTLRSISASLSIVRGCDGAGVVFLLVAAMSAYPARLKAKLQGILAVVVLMYILNELRVVGLYFVIANRNEWFSALHNYFVPIFMILVACLFFLWWTVWTRDQAETQRS